MPLVSLMPWRFDRFPKPLTIAPHVFSSSQQPNHGPWLQGSILSFVLPSATFLHIGKLFGMTAAFFSVGRKGWLGNDGPSSFLTNFMYQPLPNFPPLPNIFAVTSLPTDQCWNGRQVDGCRIPYALWPKLEDLARTIVTVYLRFHLSAFKRMICRHSWPILYLVASVSCVVLILDSLYTALCPSRSAPLTCCIRNSQFFSMHISQI